MSALNTARSAVNIAGAVKGVVESTISLVKGGKLATDPGALVLTPAGGKPVLVPAAVIGTSVTQSRKIESIPVPGRPGSIKLVHGFEDPQVTIELLFFSEGVIGGVLGAAANMLKGALDRLGQGGTGLPPTAYERLVMAQQLFQAGSDGEIVLYRMQQVHLAARAVGSMLFHSLASDDRAGADVITAQMTFVEVAPVFAPWVAPAPWSPAALPPEPSAPPPPATDNFGDAVTGTADQLFGGVL